MYKAKTPDKEAGKRLCTLISLDMMEKGITQIELGKILGIKQPFVSKITNREVMPQAIVLLRFQDFMNYPNLSSIIYDRNKYEKRISLLKKSIKKKYPSKRNEKRLKFLGIK